MENLEIHTYTKTQTPYSQISNQRLITDCVADIRDVVLFLQFCLTSCISSLIHSLTGQTFIEPWL